MRICGIDPGLQVTGYGVIDAVGPRCTIVDAGTIRSDGNDGIAERLLQIHTDLCAVLDEHEPEVLAIENVYSHYKHPQTAVLMGHVRGSVLLAASQRGIPIRQFASTRIKRCLTGNGRAGKTQMQQAIRMTLGLVACPQPHDVADALAIALCEALYSSRAPMASTLAEVPRKG